MLAGAAKQNEDLDFLRLFQRPCEGDDLSYKIEIVSASLLNTLSCMLTVRDVQLIPCMQAHTAKADHLVRS